MKTKRVEWIDSAKLFGIFLVILGHLPIANNENNVYFFTNLIYSFHMPLFFFLSGVLEKNESFHKTFSKGIRSLLIPYIFFYFLTYLWWFLTAFLRHSELYNRNFMDGFLKPFFGMLNACGFDTNYSIMINTSLWFLPALFWCKTFNAVGNAIGKYGKNVICIFGIVISLLLWKYNRFIPTSFGSACMAFPFYCIGTRISILRKGNDEEHNKQMLCIMFLFLLSFAGLLFITTFNGRVDINTILFGKYPILFFIGAITGIFLTYCFCRFIPPLHTFGKLLSRNTITIMAFHSIFNTIILKIYSTRILHIKKLGENEINILPALLISLFVLIISSFPCFIIEKYFPFLLGRKKRVMKQ